MLLTKATVVHKSLRRLWEICIFTQAGTEYILHVTVSIYGLEQQRQLLSYAIDHVNLWEACEVGPARILLQPKEKQNIFQKQYKRLRITVHSKTSVEYRPAIFLSNHCFASLSSTFSVQRLTTSTSLSLTPEARVREPQT
jgi:hypothetical protein